MSFSRTTGARASRTVVCALSAVLSLISVAASAAERAIGIRAVPIDAAALASADAARGVIADAIDRGANTVIVPIPLEGPGSASEAALIQAIVGDARSRGLRVHASVSPLGVASAGELPAARHHVIYRHPEWLMVPRELALELLALDARAPDYLGRLARWTRGSDRTGSLQLSPLPEETAAYIAGRVANLVSTFGLDGVHLEGLRFPGQDFDYGRAGLDAFRETMRGVLSVAERARLDAVETLDPFGYAEELPDAWRQFRATRLTALVTKIRTAVRAARPDALITAAVTRGADHALATYLQDWRTWADNGFIDAVADDSSRTAALLPSYDPLLEPAAAAAALPAPSAAGSH